MALQVYRAQLIVKINESKRIEPMMKATLEMLVVEVSTEIETNILK